MFVYTIHNVFCSPRSTSAYKTEGDGYTMLAVLSSFYITEHVRYASWFSHCLFIFDSDGYHKAWTHRKPSCQYIYFCFYSKSINDEVSFELAWDKKQQQKFRLNCNYFSSDEFFAYLLPQKWFTNVTDLFSSETLSKLRLKIYWFWPNIEKNAFIWSIASYSIIICTKIQNI